MIDVKTEEDYILEIEAWRKEREAALRSPHGWLSLVALHSLEDGSFTLGSSDDNRIVLPPSVPGRLGALDYASGRATLQLQTDVPVTVEHGAFDESSRTVSLVDNRDGASPTMVKVGTVSFNLHKFGDEVALRVRDSSTPTIQSFKGCRWYAIKPEYNVLGTFARHETPTAIDVATSVKTTAQFTNVGTVSFELLGRSYTLLASPAANPHELFMIFRDETAGKTTYGAGRYLYAALDDAGTVTLDFNKAYNPPCAFTPFATCSLPPAQNRLPVAIEAGELY